MYENPGGPRPPCPPLTTPMCAAMTAGTWATSLRLQDRINQHISKSISNNQKPTKIFSKQNCKEKINTHKHPQCDSAIGLHLLLLQCGFSKLDYTTKVILHLLQNKECTNHYNHQQFSILARARSAFHLSALEATYIKTFKSILCFQKEFVYSLQISH